MEATEKILTTAERLVAGVQEIEGLEVVGEPVAMVVAMASTEFNIYQVSDMMAKRGYGLSPCQNPPCIHLCVTLRHTDFIEDLLQNLKEVVLEIKKDPTAAPKDGNAPIYGMASSLPGGPVKQLLSSYVDVVLAV